MKESQSRRWRWKVSDPNAKERLGLLYEPGNWGDILKDLWLIRAIRGLREVFNREALRVLDPFAGRPFYPLLETTARRLEQATHPDLQTVLEPFLSEGRFPSSGLLARSTGELDGHSVDLAVFDVDTNLQRLWKEVPGVAVLDLETGYDAFSTPAAARADLVLVDPYNLLEAWRDVLPAVLSVSSERAVLLYLYNRAPRGSGFARTYLAFRGALREGLDRERDTLGAALGRVPADAVLARAYHEVVLIGPEGLVERLRGRLRQGSEDLAGSIGRRGAWEDPREDPLPGL